MGNCHQRHPAPVTSPTTMKPPRSAATPQSTPKETIQNTTPTARPPPPNNAQRKPHPQEKDLSVGDNRHSTVSRHPSPPLRLSSRFATPRARLKRNPASTEQDSDTHPHTVNRLTRVIDRPPGEANIVNHRRTLEVAVTSDSSLIPHPSSPSTKSQTALSSRVDRFTLNSTQR